MKFEVKWKREKKERNFLIVLSIVFAVFWVLGNYEVLGFSGLSLICVCTARVILYSIILYILLGIIWDKILAFEMMDSKEERKKSKKLYWGIVGICLICWLPYFLTLYPGVVTWDSEWQVEQAIGVSSYSNHQPWIQTLMIKFCCFLGKLISDSINTGVAIYVMFQMCVLALIYAYVIYYLYQKGTRRIYLIGCLIFYAVFPINAFYAVTMWKDVLMGAIVLLFSVILWKMECNEQTKVDWILFFITGILISLLRSNGFYSYVLCIPFIIFFMKKKRVQTGLICIATVFLVMFVKGPVMEHYKVVQPDTIEALSIPAQHIARVITDGGELTQEQEELLSKVVDLERVPKEYDSTISDPIKTLVREKGNQDYIKEHAKEYLKLWLELGMKYPGTYLKAQIDQTRGFWCPGVEYWAVSTEVKDNTFGMVRDSKLPSVFQAGLEKVEGFFYAMPVIAWFWGIGIYTWIAIAMFWISIFKKQKILVFFPVLAIVASLMIATPVFAEFRYAYAVVVTVPFFIAIGCSKKHLILADKKILVYDNIN